MTRFIHTSDWQIGMTRHFLRGEAQARYTEARLDAIRMIATVADDEGCAFVVVAGDVFESNDLDRRTVVRALDAMGSFVIPLFLLPGNHDPVDASSIYQSPTFVANCPPMGSVALIDRRA
jgi:DNA repair exonuclease SbcCD nuclease subunit